MVDMLELKQQPVSSGHIALLATVALLTDVPEDGLVRGQVGTVVEILPPDGVAVEFVDKQGATFAVAFLPAEHVMALHDRLIHQMA
jgi:class 3 adenylate cyclase